MQDHTKTKSKGLVRIGYVKSIIAGDWSVVRNTGLATERKPFALRLVAEAGRTSESCAGVTA